MRLLAGLASLAAVATATTVSKVDSLPGYANNNGYSMYSGYLTVSLMDVGAQCARQV